MMKNLTFLLTAILSIVFSVQAFAQEVTGTVKDEAGMPIVGATITVEGTTIGTTSDLDGRYSLKVPAEGSVLSVTFLGYVPQEVITGGGVTVYDFTLKEDTVNVDEVVVVGYGVQKKSVVTASIAKVSAEDLSFTAPVRMDNALKGLAAGVNVTSSSGQPGAAARIRVRGIGTINNSDPLYIVDGMPIEGGLDYLNPNDIASIEVLKDAASGAVYGARAANGVILVTTKTGSEGRTKVAYDFSYGWQSPWRERDVLNASEYAVMINEGRINSGQAPLYNDPYSYGKGTDWQKELFNYNAPMMNHQLSISGGSEKVQYLVSGGYFTQDGIVGGNYGRSNYERLTLRNSNTFKLFDESKKRNWLNSLKLTSNISYAYTQSTGVEANSTWGSPLGSALALSPMLTVYAEGQAAQDQLDRYEGTTGYVPMYDPRNGKLYTLAGPEFNEMTNPLAQMSLPATVGYGHKFVGVFGAELQIWDNLKFKSTFGTDLWFSGSDGYTPLYYLRAGQFSDHSTAFSSKSNGLVWQVENVLMYDKTIDKHTFAVLLGQSAKKSAGSYLSGGRYNISSYDRPYIDASTGLQENGEMYVSGAPYNVSALASLFARVSYDYDERYMIQATVRRDGSSHFGPNNHWAIFPSVSLGWNITNEKFLAERPKWFTSAKLRASWGKNGNEAIGDFRYTVLTQGGNNYQFGQNSNILTGVKASGLANPDLKWEESEQYDVGLDLGFFENSLTFTVDYYKKRTNGMLMTMNIPSYVGESKPMGNVGKMDNSGVEMELNYKLRSGDWYFHVGGNLTYLKNKLIEYGNDTGWANYDSFQGTGTISRAENGMPFPYFYGFKTDGVFQNAAEIDAYRNSAGEKIMPGAVPGDVRFVDVNGDGVITDDDRTCIGKGTPDWTYGFNLNLSWKGLDLSMMWQGTIGNDVFDATRRTDIASSNLPSWMLNRWTGEGTSNRVPRFAMGDNVNWRSSDLYVYDGSYMRLKNIQLGYTLPHKWTKVVFISSLRVFVAAENLLTFTKYHGFDPEISSGGTSLGIDYGVYPQARTYTVGVNLVF